MISYASKPFAATAPRPSRVRERRVPPSPRVSPSVTYRNTRLFRSHATVDGEPAPRNRAASRRRRRARVPVEPHPFESRDRPSVAETSSTTFSRVFQLAHARHRVRARLSTVVKEPTGPTKTSGVVASSRAAMRRDADARVVADLAFAREPRVERRDDASSDDARDMDRAARARDMGDAKLRNAARYVRRARRTNTQTHGVQHRSTRAHSSRAIIHRFRRLPRSIRLASAITAVIQSRTRAPRSILSISASNASPETSVAREAPRSSHDVSADSSAASASETPRARRRPRTPSRRRLEHAFAREFVRLRLRSSAFDARRVVDRRRVARDGRDRRPASCVIIIDDAFAMREAASRMTRAQVRKNILSRRARCTVGRGRVGDEVMGVDGSITHCKQRIINHLANGDTGSSLDLTRRARARTRRASASKSSGSRARRGWRSRPTKRPSRRC